MPPEKNSRSVTFPLEINTQGGHSTLKTLKNLEFDQNVKNNLENLEYEGKIEKITFQTLNLKVKFGCLFALLHAVKIQNF